MPITSAVQRGAVVYVYDGSRTIATLPAGNGPGDGLQGYTGSSISIKRGAVVYTYDEKGRTISTVFAR